MMHFLRLVRTVFFLSLLFISMASWALSSSDRGATWLGQHLSSMLTSATTWKVSVRSARLYLPFYFELSDISVSAGSDHAEQNISLSSLSAIPFLFDLPLQHATFLYVAPKGLNINVKDWRAFIGDEASSSVPWKVYIGYLTGNMEKYGDALPPFSFEGARLSLDFPKDTFEGQLTVTSEACTWPLHTTFLISKSDSLNIDRLKASLPTFSIEVEHGRVHCDAGSILASCERLAVSTDNGSKREYILRGKWTSADGRIDLFERAHPERSVAFLAATQAAGGSLLLELSSLDILQPFVKERITGSVSCSATSDSLLASCSDCTYGDQIHLESCTTSLSLHPDGDALLGMVLIKNGRMKNDASMETFSGSFSFNRKDEIISLGTICQKGMVFGMPYSLRSRGNVEVDLSRMSSSGTLFLDGFFANDALSLACHLSGKKFDLSGTVGERGHLMARGTITSLQKRLFSLTSSFQKVPSSIVTAISSLPPCQGMLSGFFDVVTSEKEPLSLRYGIDGMFSWLSYVDCESGLKISSHGEMRQARLATQTVLSTPHQESMTIERNKLSMNLQVDLSQQTSLLDTPISGSLSGTCDLHTMLSPWLEEEEWTEGQAFMDLAVGGTVKDYTLVGDTSLSNGKLDIFAIGGVLSDISLRGTCAGNRIYFEHVSASDERKGSLVGKGVLLLPALGQQDFFWHVEARASRFEIVDLKYVTTRVSGPFTLEGDHTFLSVEGEASTDFASLDLGQQIGFSVPNIDITYSPESLHGHHKLHVSDNAFRFLVNVRLRTAKPLEIRGRGLASTWSGTMSLAGSLLNPSIDGSFSTIKGTFAFAGKDFRISQGSITFHGDLLKTSRLSITASSDLPTISARVLLRGSLENPKISVESNPAKNPKEILSLILFNKELCDITPLESLQIASTAMSLEQKGSPLQILEAIRKKFGIDKIDVRSSKDTINNDMCVRVGKYISQGVIVNISKDVTSDAKRMGIEVEVAKNISAEAEISDDAEGVVSVKWKKDF